MTLAQSESLQRSLKKGVLNSSVLVAVLTDSWSTREWCRREMLEAKVTGRPVVVVDALEARVIRLFPYLGNAPTLRWRAAIAAPDATSGWEGWADRRRRWEAEDAEVVIEAALLEGLRYRHDYQRLLGRISESEVALGTPPEALTLTRPSRLDAWHFFFREYEVHAHKELVRQLLSQDDNVLLSADDFERRILAPLAS